MKFRCLSDIHMEFMKESYDLPVMDDEKNTVLLLAGDIGVARRPDTYLPFMEEMADRFMHVVSIAGNHEFYYGSFVTARDLMNIEYRSAGIQGRAGMYEREVIEFDDVRIICATLWTDMDGCDPMSIIECSRFMNDYRAIATGKRGGEPYEAYNYPLRAEDTINDFKLSRDFIFQAIADAKDVDKKVIVMTHHAPSRESISPQYKSSPANGAFVSDLSEEIFDADHDMIWLHGHVHQPQDYQLGRCRVLCNPHGYGNENPEFNDRLIIEL